jgi:3'-5' exoribonuclease
MRCFDTPPYNRQGATHMKTQFISAMSSGQKINDVFVLAEKFLGHKKDGDPYLTITLADKSGRMNGVVWDHVNDIITGVNAGDIVHVEGGVGEYKGDLQLVVQRMRACRDESFDPSDFIPATGRDVDGMFERLKELTELFSAWYLKELFGAFWADETLVRLFKTAPAAKKMHHAYIGGLLEHTLSMATLADKIARHYSGIDRDLLVAGTILHDMGKIREFEYTYRIDYSNEGRLLSHIVIGIELLEEKIRTIQAFPVEQAILLKHMIVSHHGTREFGSPEPPKTVEAVLLNYIDEIDSKVNGIREFIASSDSEEPWTPYHRIWERHFYRGKG